MSNESDKKETYQELVEYKKRARYVMMKLHKEIERLEEEIKILEQVNSILRVKLKKASEK